MVAQSTSNRSSLVMKLSSFNLIGVFIAKEQSMLHSKQESWQQQKQKQKQKLIKVNDEIKLRLNSVTEKDFFYWWLQRWRAWRHTSCT